MTERPNILVVCGRNKKPSRIAEHIFENDDCFNIRSIGLSPKSDRKISENDLKWADLVFIMETGKDAKIMTGGQTGIQYSFTDIIDSIINKPLIETTGAIDKKKRVFIHPLRMSYMTFAEIHQC